MAIVDGAIVNADIAAAADFARSKLAQESLVLYKVPLTAFLAMDGAALGITEDGTDLFRTVSSNLVTLFGRTPTTTTESAKATAQFRLPPEYVADEDVSLVVTAQFIDGAGVDSGRASFVDVAVYRQADGAIGSDLSTTTAAQTITADDTYQTKTFVITDASLAPGDIINIVLEVSATSDDGNPTQVQVGEVSVGLDIKG